MLKQSLILLTGMLLTTSAVQAFKIKNETGTKLLAWTLKGENHQDGMIIKSTRENIANGATETYFPQTLTKLLDGKPATQLTSILVYLQRGSNEELTLPQPFYNLSELKPNDTFVIDENLKVSFAPASSSSGETKTSAASSSSSSSSAPSSSSRLVEDRLNAIDERLKGVERDMKDVKRQLKMY